MFEKVLNEFNFSAAQLDLREQGYHLVKTRICDGSLRTIVEDMDQLCEKPIAETYYGGSEHRIWQAHTQLDAAREFKEFSNKVMQKLDKNVEPAHDILAIRNSTLIGDIEKLTKGRWHLDSFNKQLKIFVFITDVADSDGPFEMIPNSHKTLTKWQHAIRAHYFKLSDFTSGSGQRSYQRIDDEFVEKLTTKMPSMKFTVPAGSLLVANTSAIHRAHPVKDGKRYAFTSYHR